MTFLRPKLSMLPMNALAVREYASEYPQNIHWNVTLDVVRTYCSRSKDVGDLTLP
jgi:hypothetical protein